MNRPTYYVQCTLTPNGYQAVHPAGTPGQVIHLAGVSVHPAGSPGQVVNLVGVKVHPTDTPGQVTHPAGTPG